MAKQHFARSDDLSAIDVIDITTSDTADQRPEMCFRGFMVTTAGNVAIITQVGTTVTIPGCVVGTVYPIGVSRFLTTGTTATFIKGLV